MLVMFLPSAKYDHGRSSEMCANLCRLMRNIRNYDFFKCGLVAHTK